MGYCQDQNENECLLSTLSGTHSHSNIVLGCCLVASIILEEPCEVRKTDIIISFVEEAARH